MLVRMGLHTGEAQEREGDYFGPAVNVAARIMAAGHGGQILCSESTADVVRDQLPAGVDVLDHGARRLRGVSRAQHVWEIEHPGRPREGFPPLRTAAARVGNLVVDGKSFVGREHELDEIARLVVPGRALTLVGVGGVGKTMLACRAADRLAGQYADGVWLCELAAVGTAGSVVDAVATALGVRQQYAQTNKKGSPP